MCSEIAKIKYRNYPGYQIPLTFDIYHCPSCNTSFTIPRNETTGIYELIYTNGPDVRWYDRYWRNAEIVKNKKKPLNFLAESEDIYWAVKQSLSQIEKHRKEYVKIIEIGCGLGYLTYSLVKEGYNCKGLDISQEAINRAIKQYGNYYICADLYEYARHHSEEYDIIILTEVIEHLDDINSFIKQLSLMIRSDGKLILTTPNKSFYPDEIVWATDLPPVHCWWLSEQSIKYISSQLNMNVSFLNFRKYYNCHTTWVDLDDIKIPITPPVFDEQGQLIEKSKKKFELTQGFRRLFKKIWLINFINSQVKYLLVRNNKCLLIPKSRGPILCAILEKSN